MDDLEEDNKIIKAVWALLTLFFGSILMCHYLGTSITAIIFLVVCIYQYAKVK